jgi:hypothetical protein
MTDITEGKTTSMFKIPASDPSEFAGKRAIVTGPRLMR